MVELEADSSRLHPPGSGRPEKITLADQALVSDRLADALVLFDDFGGRIHDGVERVGDFAGDTGPMIRHALGKIPATIGVQCLQQQDTVELLGVGLVHENTHGGFPLRTSANAEERTAGGNSGGADVDTTVHTYGRWRGCLGARSRIHPGHATYLMAVTRAWPWRPDISSFTVVASRDNDRLGKPD
jgi:hypothetical protein